MLALYLICGFGKTALAASIIGGLALPFALGMLFTDVISLVAHKRVLHLRSRRARQRSREEPAAELPALRQQLRVHRIRLAIAFALLVVALSPPLWQENGQYALWVLLFGAAGCIRLEATLLAYVGKWPLVKYDAQRGDMRTTYIGRHAFFVPFNSVTKAITPQPEGKKASAALLALLREGGLGPLVRSSYSKLPDKQRHTLLLHLSLREGGAEAIRFLSPNATLYASLASEAAKPADLQQWITVLKRVPAQSELPAFENDISPILTRACEALLLYKYAPSITSARQELEDLVENLYAPLAQESPPPHPRSWLVALRLHLERHEKRLQGKKTALTP